ncbi:hypothetical protein DFH09DRAFT_1084518 [Mycena vulgaris]|nr:hypothetical protein DFH09DRAFT_1084518 [Mycena vulgaris]
MNIRGGISVTAARLRLVRLGFDGFGSHHRLSRAKPFINGWFSHLSAWIRLSRGYQWLPARPGTCLKVPEVLNSQVQHVAASSAAPSPPSRESPALKRLQDHAVAMRFGPRIVVCGTLGGGAVGAAALREALGVPDLPFGAVESSRKVEVPGTFVLVGGGVMLEAAMGEITMERGGREGGGKGVGMFWSGICLALRVRPAALSRREVTRADALTHIEQTRTYRDARNIHRIHRLDHPYSRFLGARGLRIEGLLVKLHFHTYGENMVKLVTGGAKMGETHQMTAGENKMARNPGYFQGEISGESHWLSPEISHTYSSTVNNTEKRDLFDTQF